MFGVIGIIFVLVFWRVFLVVVNFFLVFGIFSNLMCWFCKLFLVNFVELMFGIVFFLNVL